MKPLAIDLCSGLGGWTDGLLAEGWDAIGFDIERHRYGSHQYPAQLVLQDILTLDGHQFRGHASLIVASPPCQEFSYMAMPWTRAKRIALALSARKLIDCGPSFPDGYTGSRTVAELTSLFDACLRIGREAGCPIVIENVRGAQPWVGRSRWNYGSFHLWGDVPALMPITLKRPVKVATMGAGWYHPSDPRHVPGPGFNTHADRQMRADDSIKVASEEGRRIGNGTRFTSRDCGSEGVKQGGDWFNAASLDKAGEQSISRRSSFKSSNRKAASARIAKIPEALARHIARVYFPR